MFIFTNSKLISLDIKNIFDFIGAIYVIKQSTDMIDDAKKTVVASQETSEIKSKFYQLSTTTLLIQVCR